MTLAVVVVTHQSAADIDACLDALPAAAGSLSYRLVVVDNASDDGTRARLAARLPAADVLLNADNLGFAAAVNQAAAHVPGCDLLLLNPDVVPEPRAFAVLADELHYREDVGAVSARLLDLEGNPRPSAWPEPGVATLAFEALLLYNLFPRSPLHRWEPAGDEAEDVPCVSGACLLVRASCWRHLGGLDERFFLYFEDFDFGVRVRRAGYRLRLAPRARARHRLGGSAFQNRASFRRRFRESRRAFLRKHHAGLRRGALLGLAEAAAGTRWLADVLRAAAGR